jgi:hypothetical protein
MKRIKRFNESNDFKHGRIGREQLEDFFLEFIDSNDLRWYMDYIDHLERFQTQKEPTINTYFEINSKFRKMNDVDTVNRSCQLLKSISAVCNRWKLDFSIESGALSAPGGPQRNINQLVIKQEVPKVILDNFPDINAIPILTTFDGREIEFRKWLKHDKDFNFWMLLEPSTVYGGAGLRGRWLKDDRLWFNRNDDKIMGQIQTEFQIPCIYDHKAIGKSDLNYGQPQHIYSFKLLV